MKVEFPSLQHDLLEDIAKERLALGERHLVQAILHGPGEVGDPRDDASCAATGCVFLLDHLKVRGEFRDPLVDLDPAGGELVLLEEARLPGIEEPRALGLRAGQAASTAFDLAGQAAALPEVGGGQVPVRLDQQTGIEQVASDLPEDQLVQFGCVDRGRATGRVVRAIVPARGAPVVDPPPPLAALGGDARMLAATHPAAEQSTQEPPLLLEPSRAELAVGFPPGA